MTHNPLQVRAADHITLIVENLEKSHRFYVELLGMHETARPDFDFPGVWFETGKFQIHATQASELAGLAGWGDRQVKSIARGHHFAFEIENVAAAVVELEAKGILIADGPKRRPDGVEQVYVYDPDGHLVELFSR